MTFEAAEAQLSPACRALLAKAVLENGEFPEHLTPAQKVFAFGLTVLLEYEDAPAVRKYLQDAPGEDADTAPEV